MKKSKYIGRQYRLTAWDNHKITVEVTEHFKNDILRCKIIDGNLPGAREDIGFQMKVSRLNLPGIIEVSPLRQGA